MASKKKSAKKGEADAPSAPIGLKVALEPSGDQFYANFAEVAAAQHEFQISFALVPAKLTAEKIETIKNGSPLSVDAIVQIMLPPTIIPGLIRALTITKEQFEAIAGPIKDAGIPNE